MDLHDLWVTLNRPSADRFAVALRKRGIKARPADIRELFTKYVGSKQIFAPPPKLRGRFVAPHKDARVDGRHHRQHTHAVHCRRHDIPCYFGSG